MGMKNRIGSMPTTKELLDKKIPADSVMILNDDTQEANRSIKRVAIILEQQSRAFVIDKLQEVGVIEVAFKQDGYGNKMWYPSQPIGILKKVSIDKMIENINDTQVVNVVNTITQAEKSRTGFLSILEVFVLAKCYIEHYPLSQEQEV